MAKAIDIARYFIALSQDQNGDLMTNLRLQKLLYFAQAWYLARHKKPLFIESIQAWDLGPVVPSVYQQYSDFGRTGLALDGYDSNFNLSADETALLLDVYNEYDRYSTSVLVDMAHSTEPWSSVYRSGVRNIEIPVTLIQTYFEHLPKQLSNFDDLLNGDYPVQCGNRNAEGTLVFSNAKE